MGLLGFTAASTTVPVIVICVGVLYSLYGRNLDSGEAVPYNDQHWRNVVARLHLTQQQVRISRDIGCQVCEASSEAIMYMTSSPTLLFGEGFSVLLRIPRRGEAGSCQSSQQQGE